MVAREVLACGSCLIVSKEIADKQWNCEQLTNGVRFLVTDPLDTDELTECLRNVVDDPARARHIGAAGAEAGAQPGAYERFVVSWEDLFERYSQPSTSAAGEAPPSDPAARRLALEVAVPSLLAFVETVRPSIVEWFINNGGGASLPGCALDFCSVLGHSLPAVQISRQFLRSTVRLQIPSAPDKSQSVRASGGSHRVSVIPTP